MRNALDGASAGKGVAFEDVVPDDRQGGDAAQSVEDFVVGFRVGERGRRSGSGGRGGRCRGCGGCLGSGGGSGRCRGLEGCMVEVLRFAGATQKVQPPADKKAVAPLFPHGSPEKRRRFPSGRPGAGGGLRPAAERLFYGYSQNSPFPLRISQKFVFLTQISKTASFSMAKEFKRYLVTSALPLRQRPRAYRPPGGSLHTFGHLHALPAPEGLRRHLGLRLRRTRRAHHHQGPQGRASRPSRSSTATTSLSSARSRGLACRSTSTRAPRRPCTPRPPRPSSASSTTRGKFIEKSSMQYYDTEAQTFLADRYIVGTCPRCGYERAYGDQCEKCGSTLSPDELVNPHSAVSGSVPEKRETKHWYLPLDQYEGFLRKWILEGHKEWKTNVYGQCKSWLDGGLQPRAVSRDLDWGIPVPVEGPRARCSTSGSMRRSATSPRRRSSRPTGRSTGRARIRRWCTSSARTTSSSTASSSPRCSRPTEAISCRRMYPPTSS